MTIFVYGTLKNGCSNNNVLQNIDAHFLGEVETVEKFPMYQYKDPFPYLVENIGSGNIVEGELYKINDTYKSVLDRFEGVPDLYYNGKIDVIQNGKIITANCYFSTRKQFPTNTKIIKNYKD